METWSASGSAQQTSQDQSYEIQPPPPMAPEHSTPSGPAAKRGRKRKTTATRGSQQQPQDAQTPLLVDQHPSPHVHASHPGAGFIYGPQPGFESMSDHPFDMQEIAGGDGQEGLGDPEGAVLVAGLKRSVNPSKRAEQNRRAQRAFRERRDAHVKILEERSMLLNQALQNFHDQSLRYHECRQMVDVLRAENQRLLAALQEYSDGALPAGFHPFATIDIDERLEKMDQESARTAHPELPGMMHGFPPPPSLAVSGAGVTEVQIPLANATVATPVISDANDQSAIADEPNEPDAHESSSKRTRLSGDGQDGDAIISPAQTSASKES